jgi:hypothetical protein
MGGIEGLESRQCTNDFAGYGREAGDIRAVAETLGVFGPYCQRIVRITKKLLLVPFIINQLQRLG